MSNIKAHTTLSVCCRCTRCDTLQHAPTQCNTLQYAATHCNTLQYAATHKSHAPKHIPPSAWYTSKNKSSTTWAKKFNRRHTRKEATLHKQGAKSRVLPGIRMTFLSTYVYLPPCPPASHTHTTHHWHYHEQIKDPRDP